MLGIIYNIKSDAYIGHHPVEGFFKTDSLKNLDSHILWISNIKKNQITLKNIKDELFFNVKFKNILYHFNANHLDASEQFPIILNVFNNIITVFKEEYRFFNFDTQDLIKSQNFSDVLYKSKITNLVDSDNLDFVKSSFNKEIRFNQLESQEYFLGFFSRNDFIHELLDLPIPFGRFTHYPIENFSNLKNPYKMLETMRLDKSFIMKCRILNRHPIMEDFFGEKFEDKWFTDFELAKVKDYVELEALEIIIFDEKRRLKEIMRSLFKTKYNNYAFEIFCKNVVISLKENNIDTLTVWIEAFEKIFYFEKVLTLKNNNISVGYSSGAEIVLSVSKQDDIILLENNNLIYPIKLIQYILNN